MYYCFFLFILFFLLYLVACPPFFPTTSLWVFACCWLNMSFICIAVLTHKKTKNMKFEIWFTDDQYVHMRLQTWWVIVFRCWYLTPLNHKVACGDDLEIFSMMSKFHWKRIWEVIRWNIVMFPESVWAFRMRAINFSSDWCMICLP